MSKSKGRIAIIFDILKYSDTTGDNEENVTRETYMVNCNDRVSLESETVDRQSRHVNPSIITVEGLPGNILLTKDKNMMLCPPESDEGKVYCDLQPVSNLMQSETAASLSTKHDTAYEIVNKDTCPSMLPDNQNEFPFNNGAFDSQNSLDLSSNSLDPLFFTKDNYNLESNAPFEMIPPELSQELSFRQVTISADTHSEPHKICNDPIESKQNMIFNSHIDRLDEIEVIESIDDKPDTIIQYEVISNIAKSSPVSPSILNCSFDDLKHANTQEISKILQEETSNESDSTDSLDTDLQKRKRKKKASKESWEKT